MYLAKSRAAGDRTRAAPTAGWIDNPETELYVLFAVQCTSNCPFVVCEQMLKRGQVLPSSVVYCNRCKWALVPVVREKKMNTAILIM